MDAKDSEWGSLTEEFTYTEDPPLLQAKNSLRSVALRSAISVEKADAAVRLFQQQRAVLDLKLQQLLEEQKKIRFEKKALDEKKNQMTFHENQLKEARIALGREKETWLNQKKTEKRPQSAKAESAVATPAPIPADGETQPVKVEKRQSDEVQNLREQLKKFREEQKERESRSKMILDKAQRELAAATKQSSELSKRCEDLQRDVTRLKTPKPRKPTKAQETQTGSEPSESIRSEKGETSFLHPDEASAVVTETRQGTDGKVQKKFADGRVEADYPNGTHRVIYANGYSCVTLPNKDVRQMFPDGHSVYFYSETRTVHWVHPDGSQVIKFANGQVEKHQPDGSCKIKYVDGTVKRRAADGEELCEYADGVVQKTDPRGNKIVKFPSGKEVEVLKEGTSAFPEADVEFVFTKKYQVEENSHFIWDTKYQTQAKTGSRSLHWGSGTTLPYDSGVSLKTGLQYEDMIAFPPHEGLEKWPAVSLAGKGGETYWAVGFWFRKVTGDNSATILTKHIDTSGVDTMMTCVINGAVETIPQTLISAAKWKDFTTEPLYLRGIGLSTDTADLWVYSVAFYLKGMKDLTGFKTEELQNCGVSTGPAFNCKYCPVGYHSCLFTCATGQYSNNGVCTNCPSGCDSCSAAGTCLQCAIGYFFALDSQSCTACDGRCAHCWGPRNTQCYACKTTFSVSGAVTNTDRPFGTWMVANNTCEGQASLLLDGTVSFWPAPVTLPVPDDVKRYSEFSVDFWVRLSTAIDDSPENSNNIVVSFIDFGRSFYYIVSTDLSLHFEDFKTKKTKPLSGTYTENTWALVAYAMDKYNNRKNYNTAKTGQGNNYMYADMTNQPFDFTTPSMVVLNGHHSYTFRRTRCGFNNIRIWGKFRSMVEVLGDMNLYYTPQSAPPHLLVNYPVLSADKSFLVNSVLYDPEATTISWNQSPFQFVDAVNGTAVLPGSPSVYFTRPDKNLRGDYGSSDFYSGISICPFSQKRSQPALSDSSLLCRDELTFRFDKKTYSQMTFDSLNYKHLRMGLTYGPDAADPSFSLDANGVLNDAGLQFSNSIMMLPPVPPEETVPALQVRTSMTFEAWIKPKVLATAVVEDTSVAVPLEASTIFSMKTQQSSYSTRVLFIQKTGGKHVLTFFSRGYYGSLKNTATSVNLAADLATGKWVHVAVVVHLHRTSASIISGYVDGKLSKTSVMTDSTNPYFAKDLVLEPFSTPVIGAVYESGQWRAYFQGSLFEFSLYNFARSDSEIGQMVLRTKSGSQCSSSPSWLGHCPTSADMTGAFPVCVAPCSTCKDGKPTECLQCVSGFFLDGASCVTLCSAGNHANKAKMVCETISGLTDLTSSSTAVYDGKNVVVTFKTGAYDFVHGCVSAFTVSSKNKLGEKFTCKWSDTHTVLTLHLGTRATVTAGDVLTFANGALTQFPSTHLLSEMNLAAVTRSTTLPTLRASIGITQNTLSKCQDLLFTALGSEGVRLQYAWEFYVFPLDSSTGKIPEQYGAFASQHFEARLSRQFFAAADSLQAVLYVRDEFGQVKTASYTYALSYSEIPTAYFPYGNANITINRGVEYVFPVTVLETHCDGHTDKPSRVLTVTWTTDNSTSATTAILSAAGDQTLHLAKYGLETNRWYTFKAEVKDTAFATVAVFNTTMTVVAKPLVPIILGGNRIHTFNQTLTLDAKLSYDPDNQEAKITEYCWGVACTVAGKDASTVAACIKKTAYTCPAGNTKTTLDLTADDLYPDSTYQFTLTIKKDSRTSSLTTTILTKSAMVPEVKIYPLVPVKLPTTQSFLLYGNVLGLARLETASQKEAFLNNNEETVPYWRVSPAVSGLFSNPEFSYSTQVRGFDPTLTGTYKVTFNVEDLLSYKGTDYRGQAWLTAVTNSPPKAGIVYINPSWAVPAFQEVQIAIENVWDDDLPLSYEFYRVSADSTLQIGGRYNYGLLGRLMVPLTPNPLYHEVRVYDSLGDVSVFPVTFVAPGRPVGGDVLGWFAGANQKIQNNLAYDIQVAYANALTFVESLVTAVKTGIISSRDPVFSGVVGSFMTVLGKSKLEQLCVHLDMHVQILAKLGPYVDNLSQDVHNSLKSMLNSLIAADTTDCVSPSQYSNVFQLYRSFSMSAKNLTTLFSPHAALNSELRVTAGDSELVIKRDQFQHFYPNPSSGVYLTVGKAQVTVAPGAFLLKETECIDTRAVVYTYNPVDTTKSISALIDLSFAQSCAYADGEESKVISPPTDLKLGVNSTVSITLAASIDPRYFTQAVCMVYDDTLGWQKQGCVFLYADVAGGTVTCSCSSLGLIAAFLDQNPPLVDSRAFQTPAVNLFDFTISDLRYSPEITSDGEYYMNRMNPNYIQLIFFFLYLAGAFILVRLDDKDLSGKCERREEPLHKYVLKEHIFLSIFLSPYKTSLVTRVSRAYIFVTVTHCILALGGLFYFNNVEHVRDNAWDDYTNKDYLVAVYLAHIGMLMAFILKGLFNPRVISEKLVGYTVATAFNILFFIMCVWYTANLMENPTNHWLLTWFLGWITYVCILDFLLTLVVVTVLDCFCVPLPRNLVYEGLPHPRTPPLEFREPGAQADDESPLAPHAGGEPGGMHAGDQDAPENPPSTRR